MSDITYDQLLRTIAPDGNYDRLAPKPRRLLPSVFVGGAVVSLAFGAVSIWEGIQIRPEGDLIHTTIGVGQSLRNTVDVACSEAVGPGKFNTDATLYLTETYRGVTPLSRYSDVPKSGDSADIRCASFVLEKLNDHFPFQGLIQFIVPRPEDQR